MTSLSKDFAWDSSDDECDEVLMPKCGRKRSLSMEVIDTSGTRTTEQAAFHLPNKLQKTQNIEQSKIQIKEPKVYHPSVHKKVKVISSNGEIIHLQRSLELHDRRLIGNRYWCQDEVISMRRKTILILCYHCVLGFDFI